MWRWSGFAPLLNRYFEVLELAQGATGAKVMVMVIGHSFRDSHNSEAIQHGLDRGLKLFVIALKRTDMHQSRLPCASLNRFSKLLGQQVV